MTFIFQRVEAHLEGVHDGDDGEKLCASTPNDFYGKHFDGPHTCVNWVGHWFVPPKNYVCSLKLFSREIMGFLVYGMSMILRVELH